MVLCTMWHAGLCRPAKSANDFPTPVLYAFKILKGLTGWTWNHAFHTRIYMFFGFRPKSENLNGTWNLQKSTRITSAKNLNGISGSSERTWNHTFHTRIYMFFGFRSKSENLNGTWNLQKSTRITSAKNLNGISGSSERTWNHTFHTRNYMFFWIQTEIFGQQRSQSQ